jgi:hypothetical protein
MRAAHRAITRPSKKDGLLDQLVLDGEYSGGGASEQTCIEIGFGAGVPRCNPNRRGVRDASR